LHVVGVRSFPIRTNSLVDPISCSANLVALGCSLLIAVTVYVAYSMSCVQSYYHNSTVQYKGLKISIRNLQPFAEIRDQVTSCMDAFSIDAGKSRLTPKSSHSCTTHDPRNDDIVAWKEPQHVDLLDDIASNCS